MHVRRNNRVARGSRQVIEEMTREILKKLHVRVVQILHLIIDFVIPENGTKIRLDTTNLKLSGNNIGIKRAREIAELKKKRFLVTTHAIAGYVFNKRKREKMLKNRTSAKHLSISLCCQLDRCDVKNQYGRSDVTCIAILCAV